MLKLVFITSNNTKLAHARYLCRNYPVEISKKSYYGIGYIEPRTDNRKKLLSRSIHDAIERWRKNVSKPEDKMFFIEDTSVVIHTLSEGRKEYPGLDIKYWMQKHNFKEVNNMLKEAGNNRKVTVKSDVALRLSKDLQKKMGKEYWFFKSSTTGKITEEEIEINTLPFYPWLSGETFNKWFIPDGCEKPISALPIEIADKYDFRSGAFKQMINFLKEHKKLSNERQTYFPRLQSPHKYLFIICGLPCAGKTTVGELLRKYNYYVIEASDFMYQNYYEIHGVGSSVSIHDFSKEALKAQPDIVVNKILKNINDIGDILIAITGFRSPEEINIFKERYQRTSIIEVISIEADQNKRFERNLKRNRRGLQENWEDFIKVDNLQKEMGLSIIKRNSNTIIKNNLTIEDYYDYFVNNYRVVLKAANKYSKINIKSVFRAKELESWILCGLSANEHLGNYYTTTQISRLINKMFGLSKSKNNVSRYLNQNYHPYYEIKVIEGKKQYRLSQTGVNRAIWLGRDKI